MSTIASPREPPRRMPSSQNISTPTSSTRPSFDAPRSVGGSPPPAGLPPSSSTAATITTATATANSSAVHGAAAGPGATKRNRLALREYYNIRKTASSAPAGPPSVEVTDAVGGGHHEQHQQQQHETSEVPMSELDQQDFQADAFVQRALAEKGMEDLLRLYTRTLGEIRALDAEKKALVYDNYSKLIAATETIRKMRTNMDPLNPMASTLDPAIAHIYSQAAAIRDDLRKTLAPPNIDGNAAETTAQRKRRTKQLVLEALQAPDKIRSLVSEGQVEEARQLWKTPRKLLVIWKEQGVGGPDVQACIDEGDAAIKGELI